MSSYSGHELSLRHLPEMSQYAEVENSFQIPLESSRDGDYLLADVEDDFFQYQDDSFATPGQQRKFPFGSKHSTPRSKVLAPANRNLASVPRSTPKRSSPTKLGMGTGRKPVSRALKDLAEEEEEDLLSTPRRMAKLKSEIALLDEEFDFDIEGVSGASEDLSLRMNTICEPNADSKPSPAPRPKKSIFARPPAGPFDFESLQSHESTSSSSGPLNQVTEDESFDYSTLEMDGLAERLVGYSKTLSFAAPQATSKPTLKREAPPKTERATTAHLSINKTATKSHSKVKSVDITHDSSGKSNTSSLPPALSKSPSPLPSSTQPAVTEEPISKLTPSDSANDFATAVNRPADSHDAQYEATYAPEVTDGNIEVEVMELDVQTEAIPADFDLDPEADAGVFSEMAEVEKESSTTVTDAVEAQAVLETETLPVPVATKTNDDPLTLSQLSPSKLVTFHSDDEDEQQNANDLIVQTQSDIDKTVVQRQRPSRAERPAPSTSKANAVPVKGPRKDDMRERKAIDSAKARNNGIDVQKDVKAKTGIIADVKEDTQKKTRARTVSITKRPQASATVSGSSNKAVIDMKGNGKGKELQTERPTTGAAEASASTTTINAKTTVAPNGRPIRPRPAHSRNPSVTATKTRSRNPSTTSAKVVKAPTSTSTVAAASQSQHISQVSADAPSDSSTSTSILAHTDDAAAATAHVEVADVTLAPALLPPEHQSEKTKRTEVPAPTFTYADADDEVIHTTSTTRTSTPVPAMTGSKVGSMPDAATGREDVDTAMDAVDVTSGTSATSTTTAPPPSPFRRSKKRKSSSVCQPEELGQGGDADGPSAMHGGKDADGAIAESGAEGESLANGLVPPATAEIAESQEPPRKREKTAAVPLSSSRGKAKVPALAPARRSPRGLRASRDAKEGKDKQRQKPRQGVMMRGTGVGVKTSNASSTLGGSGSLLFHPTNAALVTKHD